MNLRIILIVLLAHQGACMQEEPKAFSGFVEGSQPFLKQVKAIEAKSKAGGPPVVNSDIRTFKDSGFFDDIEAEEFIKKLTNSLNTALEKENLEVMNTRDFFIKRHYEPGHEGAYLHTHERMNTVPPPTGFRDEIGMFVIFSLEEWDDRTCWVDELTGLNQAIVDLDTIKKDNSVQLALPENWKEVVDPTSGLTYYYNEQTGETETKRPSNDPKYYPEALKGALTLQRSPGYLGTYTAIYMDTIHGAYPSAEERSIMVVPVALRRKEPSDLQPAATVQMSEMTSAERKLVKKVRYYARMINSDTISDAEMLMALRKYGNPEKAAEGLGIR